MSGHPLHPQSKYEEDISRNRLESTELGDHYKKKGDPSSRSSTRLQCLGDSCEDTRNVEIGDMAEMGRSYLQVALGPAAQSTPPVTSSNLEPRVQDDKAFFYHGETASMSRRRLASNKPFLHRQVQLPVRPALLRRLSSQLSVNTLQNRAHTPTSAAAMNLFISNMGGSQATPITPVDQILHTPLQPPAIESPGHTYRKPKMFPFSAGSEDISPCPSPIPFERSTNGSLCVPTSQSSISSSKGNARHLLATPRRLSYSSCFTEQNPAMDFRRALDSPILVGRSTGIVGPLASPIIVLSSFDGTPFFSPPTISR